MSKKFFLEIVQITKAVERDCLDLKGEKDSALEYASLELNLVRTRALLETLECHKLDADIKAFDKTHATLKKDHEQIQREL